MKQMSNVCGSSILEIDLESPRIAEVLLDALRPETSSAPSYRARVSLSVNGNWLTVKIQSDDITSLRAAMNSYLAWISASLTTINLLENESHG